MRYCAAFAIARAALAGTVLYGIPRRDSVSYFIPLRGVPLGKGKGCPQPTWCNRFGQYGIKDKVSFWGSGTLKIVIPASVINHEWLFNITADTFLQEL